MSGDKRPLSSLTTEAFIGYLDAFKISFTQSAQTEIAATVRSEVSAAVAPLQVTQKEIVNELESTKAKVSEIALDNVDTKTKVDELQKQMLSMEQRFSKSNSTTQAFPDTNPPLFSHPSMRPPPFPVSQSTTAPTLAATSGRDPHAALGVLRIAKKILGFSPITMDDINYLKAQNSITDDDKAMKISILEFLNWEMKVPRSVTDTLIIKRIFPPAKQPTGWTTLYAEFHEASTADLLNQYVRNLLHGKSVSIYVPHSLFPRYSAVRDIEHSYRNGVIKHKTKIKYGPSDFILLVKPRGSNSPWSFIPLDSLPPLGLSAFNGIQSSSPPPGRTRLPSKRARTESQESNIRSTKSKLDDEPDDNASNEASEADQPEVEPVIDPTQAAPVLPAVSDLGTSEPSSSGGAINPQTKNHLNC